MPAMVPLNAAIFWREGKKFLQLCGGNSLSSHMCEAKFKKTVPAGRKYDSFRKPSDFRVGIEDAFRMKC